MAHESLPGVKKRRLNPDDTLSGMELDVRTDMHGAEEGGLSLAPPQTFSVTTQGARAAQMSGTAFGRPRTETAESVNGVLVPVAVERPLGRAWWHPSQRAVRVLAWASYVRVVLSVFRTSVPLGTDKGGVLRLCGLVLVLDFHRYAVFVHRQRSHGGMLYRQQPQLFKGRDGRRVPPPLRG